MNYTLCPFCGGEATIVRSDDEANVICDFYENDPWNGLGYKIRHLSEENRSCPIRDAEEGAMMRVFISDTKEEAAESWNWRVNDGKVY